MKISKYTNVFFLEYCNGTPIKVFTQIQYLSRFYQIVFIFLLPSFPFFLFSSYFLPLPTHSLLFTVFKRNSRYVFFLSLHLCVYMPILKSILFSYITTMLPRYLNGNNNPLVSAPSLLYSELPGCLKSDFS